MEEFKCRISMNAISNELNVSEMPDTILVMVVGN